MKKVSILSRVCSWVLALAMLAGMTVSAIPVKAGAEEHTCSLESLTEVPAVAATETTAGSIIHWKCEICGQLYWDPDKPGTKPTSIAAGKYKTDPVSVVTAPTAALETLTAPYRPLVTSKPEGLQDVETEHIWYYPASSFTVVNNTYSSYSGYSDWTYFSVVEDGNVTALKFDVKDYAAKNTTETMSDKFGVTDAKPMRFTLYNGTSVSVQLGWSLSSSMKTLIETNLETDQGTYKLYQIENNFQFPNSNGNLRVAVFGDTSTKFPLSEELAADLYVLKNNPVDIYVEMKVTGDVSCADAENLPTYYIAGFYVVTDHAYGEYAPKTEATCEQDGTKSATCTVCEHEDVQAGDAKTGHSLEKVEAEGLVTHWKCTNEGCGQLFVNSSNPDTAPTAAEQQWGKYKTDAVSVIKAPDEDVETLVAPYRPAATNPSTDLSNVNGKHIWYYPATSFSILNNEYSTYSGYSNNTHLSLVQIDGITAVKYDVAEYHTKNGNCEKYTAANALPFYICQTSNAAFGSISADELKKNANNGFVLYNIVNDFKTSMTKGNGDFFVNPFGDRLVWSEELAVDLDVLSNYTADIYVEMKVTGDVTCSTPTDTATLPTYYIAGFYMVTDHAYGEYATKDEATCEQDKTVSAKCTLCEHEDVKTETGTKGHKLTAVPYKAATEEAPGNEAYWICDSCEKWFSDANGTTEILDKTSVVIQQLAHTHTVDKLTAVSAVTATETAAGNVAYWTCTCGQLYWDPDKPGTKPESITAGKYKTDAISVITPPINADEALLENYRNEDITVPAFTEFTGVNAKHFWYYPASSFTVLNEAGWNSYYKGNTHLSIVQEDGVTAVKYDITECSNTNNSNLAKYKVSEETPMVFNAWVNSKPYKLGELTAAQLTANKDQGYALYLIAENYTYTGPQTSGTSYVQPFDDYLVKSEELAVDLYTFRGHEVDIYVYMKVEGDVSCTTNDLPTYYIAGYYMVTKCDYGAYTSDNNATCQQDGTERATCSLCEHEDVKTDVGSSELAHKYTSYVFNNDASGSYRGSETASCDHGCGATHTRDLDLNLTAMTIAIPDGADDVTKTAANELVSYVEQITGKTIAIVKESEAVGDVIYIGATEFAETNGVTCPVKEKNDLGEGWAIKAVGRDLVLAGGETRGVLYAVYHLLEDVLGVRWWNLWEEYVPAMERAMVPINYDDNGVPVFEYRDIYIGNEKADTLFFVRNRLNGFTSNAPAEYGGEENYGSPYHSHTFGAYFPASEYFENNKDWFAWSDSQGKRISSGQLCLSNEELYEAFKEKLLANIAADFEKAEKDGTIPPRYYAVTPNDTGGFCECDACDAAVAVYGESGHLLNFVNKLARAVKETEYGDKVKLETLGYWHYVNAPTGGVKAEDNVVLRFADNYMDVMHNINHPNNADFKSRMQAWEACLADGNFFMWDYAIFYSSGGISPSLYKYGENFAAFAEMGVNGYFVENEAWVNSDMWDMQLWLLAKLIEDPTLGDTPAKYEALMDEFIYGYYGAEAGKYIEAYLDLMNERMEANSNSYRFGATIVAAEWLTVEDILASDAYFEKATAAAGDDEVLLRRINDARSGLDSVIMYKFTQLSLEAARKGIAFTLDQKTVGNRLTGTLMELIAIRGKDARAQAMLDTYSDYIPAEETEMPEAPAAAAELPEELADVDIAHIWDYPAGTVDPENSTKYLFGPYSVGEVQTDTTSLVGKAVVYEIGSVSDPSKYAVTNSQGLTCNLLTGDGQMVNFDTLFPDELIANDGKYHLYKIVDNADPFKVYAAEFDYLYMFNWDLQNKALAQDLKTWQNHKVDVYISMKIEGDVTCTDSSDMPVYYIDRMIMVTKCDSSEFTEGTDATCLADATKSGSCPICEKRVTVTIPNTKLAHKYTNYVSDGTTAGTQTAACDLGCGTTKTIPYGTVDLNDEIAAAHNTHVYKYYASDFVDRYFPRVGDSDSEYGNAILVDTGKMTSDKALQYFAINEENTMSVNIYSGVITGGGQPASVELIEFTKDNLIVDGKYHMYKAENVQLDTSVVYEYLWMFRSWQFQLHTIPFAQESSFDFYISMKVEGDISCEDPDNMPKYYIDYIAAVGSCDDYIVKWTANNDATCTADGTESGTCFICGEKSTRTLEGTKLPHELTPVEAKAATEQTDGNKAYWTCDECGKWFADAEGKTEITDKTSVVIPKLSHVHTLTAVQAKAATETAAGNKTYWTCTCGKWFADAEGKSEIADKSSVVIPKLPPKQEAGKLENTTDPEKNALGGDIQSTDADLFDKVLSAEDKAAVARGEDVDIYLSVKDISKTVSDADKAAIGKVLDDAKVGMYLDISLFKQIGESRAVQVTETDGGIKITLKLPQKLVNTDSGIVRTYGVIRVHDGVATALECTHNSKEQSVSFTSDRFSTYALTYTDAPVEEADSPDTGDSVNLILFALLAAAALLGVGAVLLLSKKSFFS